jgi:hypothetical protein
MRKVLIPAAALMLCAVPAAAQQAQPQVTDAVVPAPAAMADAPSEPRQMSLYPTTEQVKSEVRAAESARHDTAPLGSKDWWYVVAAVAVGVIIAAIVL